MKTNELKNAGPPLSFRQFVQTELARRCSRSPQYSLRAFARFLALDHSTLSQLLRGKRRFTERMVRRLGVRLGLDADSIAEFARAEASNPNGNDSAQEVIRLATDTATMLAEWQHYAILELLRLQDFRPDVRWISRVLNLSVDQVNVALQRLLRLGLLTMDAPDRWTDRSGDTTASVRGFTQVALQRLLEQSRERLLAAMTAQRTDQCNYSSMTFAVSSDGVAKVIDAITQFRRELLALVRQHKHADHVYQLEISFVPLTKGE